MHRPAVLFVLLILMATAVVLLHLVPGLDRFLVEIQIRNALHVVGFASVAAATVSMVPGSVATRAIVALLASAIIGASAEFAQQLAGSSFDIEDLYRDVAGATLFVGAWLLWTAPDRLRPGLPGRIALRTIGLLPFIAIFVPLAYWGGILVVAKMQAPVIHDFDRDWAGYFVAAINATHHMEQRANEAHVSVTLSKRPRSGVTLAVAARNWREADRLLFDAWITSEAPVNLSVHINDGDHVGRFRDTAAGTVMVNQERATYGVSIADVLSQTQSTDNVGNIRQIAILGRDRTEGAVLHIDNVRIE